MNEEIVKGDKVRGKKPHPCGTNMWIVKHLGVDAILTCEKCGREVTIKRVLFEKNFKKA